MSTVSTDRAAIAAALSTVDGVHGYTYPPTAPCPGDGWATLPSFARQDGIVWRPSWTVVVVLPSDERAASTWLDQHFDAIVAALQAGPVYPDSAQPALMQTGVGDRYVLEITCRS